MTDDHAARRVNLASPDPELRERSRDVMVAELDMGSRYGARYVNAHIGSHKGAGLAGGLAVAGETAARILDLVKPGPDVPMLVLEDSAGQGDSVGVTMAELGAILRGQLVRRAERVTAAMDVEHDRATAGEARRPDVHLEHVLALPAVGPLVEEALLGHPVVESLRAVGAVDQRW